MWLDNYNNHLAGIAGNSRGPDDWDIARNHRAVITRGAGVSPHGGAAIREGRGRRAITIIKSGSLMGFVEREKRVFHLKK